jgi:hypothetical protein
MCANFHQINFSSKATGGKMEEIHLPLMFAPARLAVGLEPLSAPDVSLAPIRKAEKWFPR